MMPTFERIRDLFLYDPLTGWLTNRITRNSRAQAGERAGCENERGYRQVWIDGIKYYEHRVIWCYMTGQWPDEVDHRNGFRWDNEWQNLREVDRSQNCHNADYATGASALKGVSLRSDRPMWRSTISARGQSYHLGDFVSADEAHLAYVQAAELLHGEHAFHNRPQPFRRRL